MTADQEPDSRRVFEMYVDEIVSESQLIDEALVVRLRWFAHDVDEAATRFASNPAAVVQIVQNLSAVMQDLDACAGSSERAHETVQIARRFALVFPEWEEPAAAEPSDSV